MVFEVIREPNDTIPQAFPIETAADPQDAEVVFGPGGLRFFRTDANTFFGNNFSVSPLVNEVDFVSIYLRAGDQVTVDAQVVDEGFDPVLRLFDSQGTQVAFDNDSDGLDSSINFTAPTSDTYYAGVSSYANVRYDPFVEGSGSGALSDISRGPAAYDIIIERNPAFIEAEDLDLVNYRVENNDFASNGELISLRGAGSHTGSASTTFTGRNGLYDIVVGYFDEKDGQARFSFEVNGRPADNWAADQDLGSGAPNENTFTRRTISGVELEENDILTIVGTSDGGDYARIDDLEILPRDIFSAFSDSTIGDLVADLPDL